MSQIVGYVVWVDVDDTRNLSEQNDALLDLPSVSSVVYRPDDDGDYWEVQYFPDDDRSVAAIEQELDDAIARLDQVTP